MAVLFLKALNNSLIKKPLCAPNILSNEEYDDFEKNDKEMIEGFSGVSGFFGLLLQLLLCILSFYSVYINLKCNHTDFLYFMVFACLIVCCPLCTVPYLLYKYFVKKCGRPPVSTSS